LAGPEVSDERDPCPGGVWDEVVVSLDDFGGEQGGDDGSEALNNNFGSQVDQNRYSGSRMVLERV
jgi:hypothetical protein